MSGAHRALTEAVSSSAGSGRDIEQDRGLGGSVSAMVSAPDCQEHVVTDAACASGARIGVFLAVCGEVVLPASMTTGARSRCPACRLRCPGWDGSTDEATVTGRHRPARGRARYVRVGLSTRLLRLCAGPAVPSPRPPCDLAERCAS